VRLKSGDPGVFARGQEEADALNAAGIAFEIVPGVTAASGASAAMGGFLTERGTCDTLVLATGQSQHPKAVPNWITTLHPGTRVAVYMGVGMSHHIAQALIDAGHAEDVTIDVVAKAQTSDQVIAHCTPRALVSTLEQQGISNPAIIFVTWPEINKSADVIELPRSKNRNLLSETV